MIEEALGGAGLRTAVTRVADGREALDYLNRVDPYTDATRPDLILLDLNMPRMDGRETLAAIKNDDELKAIPVVILTTSGAAPDIVSSYQHRRSEEHTSELQSRQYLVCRRLLEKKNIRFPGLF